MSQRVKRPNRSDDGSVPVKRRKRPTTTQEEEEASALASWRPINDLKIYNRTTTEAPAELFRKDLISAMKLPDSEPLAMDEYWVIVDQWKQEWERGVQVPVNPDSLPEPTVTVTHCASVQTKSCPEFKPPKTRYIRITKDDRFQADEHYLSTAPAQAEAACSYDLDECDVAWMRVVNAERLALGLSPLTEDQLERVMERLELRCWDKIQAILRNEEGLGIEYDENVICDVCRSPDSEEGNEMVFCDSCNICVHQACYGITRIPEGQWLCCTCQIKQRPDCVLCPNKGGAMKSTRSGQKWAHVSCALWIPEVSIGCVERMEPITKISSIPQSRWALICVLCRERVGSCIQCSVKTCKTAYHVTCAFKHGLEMRAIIEDENADDGVKLRSYCEKHSKSSKKERSSAAATAAAHSEGSENDEDTGRRKKRKDMTSEEKNQARAVRLQEIEAEFFRHVTPKDIAVHIDVDAEAVQCVYNYWKLKRKSRHNKPLLPPKCDDADVLSQSKEQADVEKMKMFVQLRQDLERVRNLCYMVSRREKLSRMYFKLRESTFQKQCAVLQLSNLAPNSVQAVLRANRGPSIYDRVYSNSQGDETINLDSLLARIVGVKSPPESGDESKLSTEINGLFKDVKNNPYKKVYFNGSSKRRSASLYGSGLSSASNNSSCDDDDVKPTTIKPKHNKENRLHSDSCSDDEKPPTKKRTPNKNSKIAERRRKRLSVTRKYESSSEDDEVKHLKKEPSNSRLTMMEKELGMSTDSDELMPIRSSSSGNRSSPTKKAITSIYSDSSSSSDSSSRDASDSRSQSKMRTKAAVKEFSHKPSTSSNKSPNKSSPENRKKTKEGGASGRSRDGASKKKDYVPSDLIVPQRQAAKKATENLKSTTTSARTKELLVPGAVEIQDVKPIPTIPVEEKPAPIKQKKIGRPPKERKDDSKEEKRHKEMVKKEDVFDLERELDKTDADILAYVPQRQAAKKAAEHIKGLGKPAPGGTATEPQPQPDDKKKDTEKRDSNEERKKSDKVETKTKIVDQVTTTTTSKRRSSSNSSASSSSSSSSDSSSSSSSDTEDDRHHGPKKPSSQEGGVGKEIQQQQHQPQTQQQKSGDRSKTGGTKDWPFLDKAAQSAASTSSSDSSDSSRASSPRVLSAQQRTTSSSKSPRSAPPAPSSSNKSRGKEHNKRATATASEREEPCRTGTGGRGKGRPPGGRGRPRSTHASDRLGDARVRSGDHPKRDRNQEQDAGSRENAAESAHQQRSKGSNRKGKSSELDKQQQQRHEATSPRGGGNAVKKLFSPVREAKVTSTTTTSSHTKTNTATTDADKNKMSDSELGDLEKEIMDRKAASSKTTKSKFDRLFGSPDIKLNKSADKLNKSPVKENKEPTTGSLAPTVTNTSKRSPSKSVKSLDDIFSNKISNSLGKSPDERPAAKQRTVMDTPNKLVETQQIMSSGKPDEFNKFDVDGGKQSVPQQQQQHRNVHANTMAATHPNDDFLDNLDIDILDGGFGSLSKDEEISKMPLTFNISSSMMFKEDSKEDSARETLNLVEKLRGNMGLKSNNTTTYDVDDALSIASSKNEDRLEFPEQIVPTNSVTTPNRQTKDEKIDDESTTIGGGEVSCQVDTKYDGDRDYDKYQPRADNDKSVPEVRHQHLDVSAQSDERWVPPSESYPNMQAVVDHHHQHKTNVFSDTLPTFSSETTHRMLSSNLQHEIKNQSPGPERITRTPFLDTASSMDCMPSPMPYNDIHPQAKWADSHVMPNRRSSSSSVASSTSNLSSRRHVDLEEDSSKGRQTPFIVNHNNNPASESIGLPLLPISMQFPPNSMDAFAHFAEAQLAANNAPVSLFPPSSNNAANTNNTTQIPFPSPGAAMFPPPFGASYPTSLSVISPHVVKPLVEETAHPHIPQAAAFTSSQHNMALTAAMVNLQAGGGFTPKPVVSDDDQHHHHKMEQSDRVVEVPASSPALSTAATTPNHIQPSPNPSIKSNSSSGKKSPSKPTRTSARFISQQPSYKSPGKSPGKSPRQEVKSTARGRDGKKSGKSSSTGRGTQSQSRGRGRGRGRGRPPHLSSHEYEYNNANTIHNKLVGTVYDLDFDDDMSAADPGDLRAMRERRKSADLHDLHRSKDSPKYTSSPSQKGSTARYSDLSELRPPTPIEDHHAKPVSPTARESSTTKTFTSAIVPPSPVLPGPVDMRTYNNAFDGHPYNEANLLGAFATGTTEAPAHEELDEDLEKEFHSALTASLSKKPDDDGPSEVPELNKIKVSLSDSRNQLKVKIKGPISNYTCTPTVAPLPPASETTASTLIHTNAIISAANNNLSNILPAVTTNSSGANFHRMRKKELLRQYCSQGMGDSMGAAGISTTPVTPSLNRTIITIPKAVASMTSIPTKDDYRDYRTDDLGESKAGRKDKIRPGLQRELRHMDLSMTMGMDEDDRRGRGNSNNGSSASLETIKRRGRPPRPSAATITTTPKLKIKIGGNHVVNASSNAIVPSLETTKMDNDRRDRIRPPKKRLSAVAKPSVEDLKRESMKFRKQVMADFDDKKEKKKKDKSNRKSKKRKKQDAEMTARQVDQTNHPTNAKPKLIIRFKKNENPPEKDPLADNSSKSNVTTAMTTAAKTTETKKKKNIEEQPKIDNNKSSSVNVSSKTSDERTKAGGLSVGTGTGGKTSDKVPAATKNVEETTRTACVGSNPKNSGNNTVTSLQQQQQQQTVTPINTPIKLKLARCQEGSGYVMKAHHANASEEANTTATTTASNSALNLHAAEPPPPVHPPTPLPLNKDCEVR